MCTQLPMQRKVALDIVNDTQKSTTCTTYCVHFLRVAWLHVCCIGTGESGTGPTNRSTMVETVHHRAGKYVQRLNDWHSLRFMVMKRDPEALLRSNSFPSSFRKGSGCSATMTG